jgi:ribosomal protein S20
VNLIDRNSTMFSSTALPTTTAFAAAASEQQTTIILRNLGTGRFVDLFVGGAPGVLDVVDPIARIADIQAQVLADNLNDGLKTALQNPLKKATEYLSDVTTSNDGNAIKELQKFIDTVNALPEKVISKADATRLTRRADKAIFTIDELQPC